MPTRIDGFALAIYNVASITPAKHDREARAGRIIDTALSTQLRSKYFQSDGTGPHIAPSRFVATYRSLLIVYVKAPIETEQFSVDVTRAVRDTARAFSIDKYPPRVYREPPDEIVI